MWLNHVLFPIELTAIVVTLAIWAVTKYEPPLAVTLLALVVINLPTTKIRAEEYGTTGMVAPGDIKLFKKAFKRSDEGSKLNVKLVKESYRIKCDREFLRIEKFGFLWLLTPKTYWIQDGFSVVRGNTDEIEVETVCRDVGREKPRWKAEIVGQTWRHATKNGDRDYRFKNNYQIPIVRDWIAVLRMPTRETMEFVCRSQAEADAISSQFMIVFKGREFTELDLKTIGGWLRKSDKGTGAKPQIAALASLPVENLVEQEALPEPVAVKARTDNPLRPTWQQFAARQPE
ncbi:hypothetical protein [Bosea sp. ANAM02]|uniref:hypothetical protein n=1 Tax=Bosea sp. ANAM02 TaxID=2020412 RepID=UPI00140F1754|nr:hypothetical protein [Bosea sp. ANAM02]BCB22369.1 hypothetical protein OCUBac02_52630 [Bosea sp. ANAM02]